MELAIDSSASLPDLPKALYEELQAAISGSVYPRNDVNFLEFSKNSLRSNLHAPHCANELRRISNTSPPEAPETEVFASATTPTPTPTMSSVALPLSTSTSVSPTKTMKAGLTIPSPPLWSSSTSTLNSSTPTQDSTSRLLPIPSSTSSTLTAVSYSVAAPATELESEPETVQSPMTSQSLNTTPKPPAPPPPPLTLPLPLSLPLGTLPYPEWRIRTVNNLAQASVVEGEAEGEGEVVRRGSVGCGYGFEEVESGEGDTKEEEVNDDDVSDLEWEGWARDLERQCRVRVAEEKEEEERRRKLGGMRIKVDNQPTTRSWVVVAPSPKAAKLEQISQPLTFATPFEQATFASPFDVSDRPPPTPLSPLPISPPSLPSLTPPPSLSPPPPTPIDLNAPEHHGTMAGAHYNRQYHPYTFQRRSISPLLSGEVGAGAGEQGDEQAALPLSPTSPVSTLPPRMTHTITSTVSVGLGNGEVADGGSARRRSATISVQSRLLRKRDKEKDKDKGKGKGKRRENEQERKRAVEQDDKTTLKAGTSSKDPQKAKFAAGFADPAATSILSSSADPRLDRHWLTQSIKGV
ncbi:hypothetical protein PILCRDRAFT_7785, partial [Piloderma croceum F 1598]